MKTLNKFLFFFEETWNLRVFRFLWKKKQNKKPAAMMEKSEDEQRDVMNSAQRPEK